MTHHPNPMNTDLWQSRLEVMNILTEIQATESVHLKVEEILRYSTAKEATAKDIVKILKTTKDEKQILVQLSKLIINPKE